jgi:hypothetical protein
MVTVFPLTATTEVVADEYNHVPGVLDVGDVSVKLGFPKVLGTPDHVKNVGVI